MNSKKMKNIRLFSTLVALLIAGAMTVGASAQPQADWFVDGATGSDNNTGQSWPQAYATVRKALGAAGDGDLIFVAAGTYFPDEINGGDSDDREDTFSLVDGVELYGGFLNGDVFQDRDPFANETILSGDIDQNDGLGEFENNDNNSGHVVTADGVTISTIIDGFTITAGNADFLTCPECPGGPGTDVQGGGMLIVIASPVVYLCTFDGNEAHELGGGIVIVNGSPVVFLCTFDGNLAPLGGGMAIEDGSPAIIRSTFTGNSAPDHGGGAIDIKDASDPIVINTSFIGNDGNEAGAVHIEGTGAGGTFVNCLFSVNTSDVEGGAINPGGSGVLDFINCTFADNVAIGSGGGAISTESGSGAVNLANCILWGNEANGSPNQIDDPANAVSVTYSCVEGTLDPDWDDGNNINDDPLFFDPVNANYRLAAGSPCIEDGNNADVPCDEFDIDGDGEDCDSIPPQDTPDLDLGDRIVGTDVDMGPYESVPCPWDLDGDCVVGAADLLILLVNWGRCGDCDDCPADLDANCTVGASDLLILLANWG